MSLEAEIGERVVSCTIFTHISLRTRSLPLGVPIPLVVNSTDALDCKVWLLTKLNARQHRMTPDGQDGIKWHMVTIMTKQRMAQDNGLDEPNRPIVCLSEI